MATQTSGSTVSNTTKQAPKAAAGAVTPERRQARSVAETAVDVPVGAVLEISDRLSDLVEPFTHRTSAERKLKSYRTQLTRTVKRAERRGASARRKATTEAKRTRSRVEREARRRRRTVETNLRRNRDEVETRVRRVADQIAALR
jgi:hypothetical protein